MYVSPNWAQGRAREEIDRHWDAGLKLAEQRRFEEALDQFEAVVRLCSSLNDRECVAESLFNVGLSQHHAERAADALATWRRTLPAYRELGDTAKVASTLMQMALSFQNLGRLVEAREAYAEALSTARRVGDAGQIARVLQNYGPLLRQLGLLDDSLSALEEARSIWSAAGERLEAANCTVSIANIDQERGRYDEARRLLEEALHVLRETGGTAEDAQGKTLSNLASALVHLGRYAEALRASQDAERIARRLHIKADIATALIGSGFVYLQLDRYDDARNRYAEALRLAIELEDVDRAGLAATNLAAVLRRQGRPEAGLQVLRSVEYPPGTTGTNVVLRFTAIGQMHEDMRQFSQAQKAYENALARARELDLRREEERAIVSLGTLYLRLDQPSKALEFLSDATVFAAEVEDRESQWVIASGLQDAFRSLGKTAEAIFHGKRAVNIIQSIREHSSSLDPLFQASFRDKREPVYRVLAGLLLDAGRLSEAEQVMNMLKEEEYFDFLQRDVTQDPRSLRADPNPRERALMEEYSALSRELTTLGRERAELLRITAEVRTPLQVARLQALGRQLPQGWARFSQLLGSSGKRLEGAAREPTSPVAAAASAMQIATRLGGGTVVLHYLVQDNRLRILLSAASEQLQKERPISRVELNRMIGRYWTAVKDPRSEPVPLARALYAELVAPVEADLRRLGARTLMLSLDGVLRYAPFAALHSGRSWLGQEYALSQYTPAAKPRFEPDPRAQWRVAAFGVSRGGAGFDPLPAVPRELDAIVKEERADDSIGVLPGTAVLDGAFTPLALQRALTMHYAVIHVASHFRFQATTIADSTLLLGESRTLSLAEIAGPGYLFGEVSLLTLSACNTALNNGGESGRELEGLAVTLQMRGAQSVLATLWSVSDMASGDLMQAFYSELLNAEVSKAEALRRAQMKLAGGQSHAHPYFWGGYVLMGNWL